jgi:RsiW-degrading membrane proteinase PrsW (M82 family)
VVVLDGAAPAGFSATAGAVGGRLAQASSNSNTATAVKLNWFFIAISLKLHFANIQQDQPENMWVLALEAFVALTLLILIVWWTKPVKRNDEEEKDDEKEE